MCAVRFPSFARLLAWQAGLWIMYGSYKIPRWVSQFLVFSPFPFLDPAIPVGEESRTFPAGRRTYVSLLEWSNRLIFRFSRRHEETTLSRFQLFCSDAERQWILDTTSYFPVLRYSTREFSISFSLVVKRIVLLRFENLVNVRKRGNGRTMKDGGSVAQNGDVS